jgi:mannobiose 2-epimerase
MPDVYYNNAPVLLPHDQQQAGSLSLTHKLNINHGIEFDREQAVAELRSIATWWLEHAFDSQQGGFVGEIDSQGRQNQNANKGVVLNSRILWFFSELCVIDSNPKYREAADRAFDYLLNCFDDQSGAGAFWELAPDGAVIDSRKQVYAQAFCIYAFCAYFRLTAEPLAISKALEYFKIIENRALDRTRNGYFEGFSRNWQKISTVHSAAGDINGPKPMNTQLHLLEAYTSLLRVNPSEPVKQALRNLICLFCENIFDPVGGHLRYLFDANWNVISSVISYGHDIEASWLLWEASEVLGDRDLADRTSPIIHQLAKSCLHRGLGESGQLCEEYEPWTQKRSVVGVWWIQAEAIVGFLNAWRLTGNDAYQTAANQVWSYINSHLKDHQYGEWRPHHPSHQVDRKLHYKAGAWKGPYHNGRAMIEACRQFDLMSKNQSSA